MKTPGLMTGTPRGLFSCWFVDVAKSGMPEFPFGGRQLIVYVI